MKHIIAYNDVKNAIDGILPEASHTLIALVTMFQSCDDEFMKLISEKTEISNHKELSISAAELLDAYEMVEDMMNTMGMLISNIGKDEKQGINSYINVSEFIEPAKEIVPVIQSIIIDISSQMSDFLELHKSFEYSGIDVLNPYNISNFMNVNKKIARISHLLRLSIEAQYHEVLASITSISSSLSSSSMVFEALESIKGNCYASVIDGISIIEVGETESEVSSKTREYFDGDMDDNVKIVPCSSGLYKMVKYDGEIPDEWDEVDGVLVLPNEKELYKQSAEID